MNMKPIIGVMPLWDEEKKSIWMLPGYMNGIIDAGGIPMVLPFTDNEDVFCRALDICSGFLLTGGQDVDPMIYGERKRYDNIVTCTLRDKLDAIVLNKAVELDKPLLGICRGIQFMNAASGGTLYQDIPLETGTSVTHHQTPPYEKPVHEVMIVQDTPLGQLLKKQILTVNSYHHQSIKDLSPVLECMARAEDGLIEAVYMPRKKFIWGVQWHPEFSYKADEDSRKIFKAFIEHSC